MISIIHPRDVAELIRRVKDFGGSSYFGRIFGKSAKRVQRRWSLPHEHTISYWTEIPAIRRRINRLITGDESLPATSWVASTFLENLVDLRALSIGCGMGNCEIEWARTGKFASITGIDVSESRIQTATESARALGLDHILQFDVADAKKVVYPDATFDVIICEGALHHISGLDMMIPGLRRWLKPDGWLVLNDFVGPRRFQWSRRQISAINEALQNLPEKLRRTMSGHLKSIVWKPGILTMWLHDPSEAVESDKILEEIGREFHPLFLRGYGGTVLHLVLKNIAHNFENSEDDFSSNHLRELCAAEDELLRRDGIGHDFVFAVFKPGDEEK